LQNSLAEDDESLHMLADLSADSTGDFLHR